MNWSQETLRVGVEHLLWIPRFPSSSISSSFFFFFFFFCSLTKLLKAVGKLLFPVLKKKGFLCLERNKVKTNTFSLWINQTLLTRLCKGLWWLIFSVHHRVKCSYSFCVMENWLCWGGQKSVWHLCGIFRLLETVLAFLKWLFIVPVVIESHQTKELIKYNPSQGFIELQRHQNKKKKKIRGAL